DDENGQPKHVWQYRVTPNEMPTELNKLRLPTVLNRNLDHNWQQALLKPSAERRVLVSWDIQSTQQALNVTVTSEEGIRVSATLNGPFDPANNAEKSLQQLQDNFAQLGNTIYPADKINVEGDAWSIPGPQVKALRRELIDALTTARV